MARLLENSPVDARRERHNAAAQYGGEDVPPGQKGFTLIELLVVIAIIALLLAILTPVLSMARKQARALQRATTERRIEIDTACEPPAVSLVDVEAG